MSLKKQELESLFAFQSSGLRDEVKSQILKPTGRGNVYAARDYISANCLLAEYRKRTPNADMSSISSSDELWNALHPATRFRLRAYTPCLAARYDELKDSDKKKCFDDPNWVATEKINGCRGWLICVPDGMPHLYSRNYSDKDCSLLEYWDHIYQECAPHKDIFAVDVEIKFEPGVDIREDLEALGLETDSPLEAMVALLHTYPEEAIKIQQKFKDIYHKDLIVLRLIAPLYFEGKNYLRRTLGEGMEVYDACVRRAKELGINVQPIQRCNGSREEKEIFLNTIIASGGEGVVFHNKKGSYCTSENRSKTSFIKLKRTITDTEKGVGLGDSLDCYVTGFKVGTNGTANEGLIAALNMSIYINDNGKIYEHMIASIPNIEKAQKELMTWNNAEGAYPTEVTLSDGTTKWISLNPEFDHLVAECTGQALSSVSRRLEHPRMLRWRVERDPNSCIYTKEFIDANTTAVGIKY